jgi:DNA-binding transcriptional LysR family regulator
MNNIAYAYLMSGFADVEVRHLQALRAVAEEGTFGRAASRLGFSQAAISQQIAGLERVVGTPVFDRPGGPRPVRLTPVGHLVLRHAEAVLDRLAIADAELEELRSGSGGHLTVGTFQSVSVRLLPTVIAQFRAESPAVEVSVVQLSTSAELAAGVRDGSLDVAFLDVLYDYADLAVDPVLRDPYVVVTTDDDPVLADLAAGAPYPTRALAERPLIASEVCDAMVQVEAELALVGVTPRYAFRTNDNGALQAMVAAGMGAAIMPLLAVDESDSSVRVMPTDPPMALRDIVVARRAGASVLPAAERFAELAVAAGGGRDLALRPRRR